MPKYKDQRMIEWKNKGYMSFMKYAEYKQHRAGLAYEHDRHLLTFLYFTGARPAELIELKREDVFYRNNTLSFNVVTLKRKGDRLVRRLDFSTIDRPELIDFWNWIKQMPNSFYVFAWLRPPNYSNPRMYIKHNLGLSAYFFRHNINSLLSEAGATKKQRMLFKGAQDERSIIPYDHLSKDERDKIKNILSGAIE